ncbi:MAG: acyl transferase [Bacteroidota bacterium]
MFDPKSFIESLPKSNKSTFDNHAIELFKYQSKNNLVYRTYLENLKVNPGIVQELKDIPFMPIEFFKHKTIKTNEWEDNIVFESSGTTGINTSKHHIYNLSNYHKNARQLFETEYGAIEDKIILGLLPSYLERSGSSLVSMVDHFIKLSKSDISGFYLYNTDELVDLMKAKAQEKNIILFGVTFALLNLAEQYDVDMSHVTVIETGGMKGMREEIVKEELYEILGSKLKIKNIYSEYGMTELLSQAYGKYGKFTEPKTMKILIRDINDPFSYLQDSKTGGINIIDLANAYSCAFIETKDIGRKNPNGTFEVLGRFDNSDIRGCNLLVN